MSQLDISIIPHYIYAFLLSIYLFFHYISMIIIKFWYNQKLRALTYEFVEIPSKRVDNTIFIKRILKL